MAKYRAISGDSVARAMVKIAQKDMKDIHIYENDVIHTLGMRS